MCHCARETIKDETGCCCMGPHHLFHHADHNRVGYQLSFFDIGIRLAAQFRAGLTLCAQDIAG